MKLRAWADRSQPADSQSPGAPPVRGRRLRSVLIAPDRKLGRQFLTRAGQDSGLLVTEQIDAYPPFSTLAALARSARPEVVLLDLATDLAVACGLIRSLVSLCPDIHVVGLHERKDADALMSALRVGATEFLYSPFEPEEMRGALARIDRLRRSGGSDGVESGRVIAFSSAKPGSGATTLATQTALALRALTGERVLLADLNLWSGLLGADIVPTPIYSVLDGLDQAQSLDINKWSSLTHYSGQIDLLPAPATPYIGQVEPERLTKLLQSARQVYDWTVLDLPAVFHTVSQMALSEVDQGFVVITTELPSLHLARRSAAWLKSRGFGRDRYQVVVNRAVFSGALDRRAMEEVLNCPVFATLPNDYGTLHKLVRFGEMPAPDTELGASLRKFAVSLAGGQNDGSATRASAYGLSPIMAR